ncbi:sialidase family protein, partial [Pirellulales bacterium]|nr:sialidase family protein [Pirellulales bacterium]
YVCRSSDGGLTWSEPDLIFQPDESQHPVSTTCRIGRDSEGNLIGWACLFDRTSSDAGLANPATEGFCRTDFCTVRSTDEGTTWGAPQPVEMPVEWNAFETCAPPIVLAPQRLFVFTRSWRDWEGNASPWGVDGMALLSHDDGKTWPDFVRVFGGRESNRSANEQALTRLTDGRILAMCWTIDENSAASLHNRMAFSEDDGFSFSEDHETPLHGETCRPLGLADNKVLIVYRRVDQRGLWAQLAQIDGSQWLPLEDRLLWGGDVESHRTDLESPLAQMSTLKFGCPAITQLSDGDLFVVFWCVEDCVSVIRWLRLRLVGSGIGNGTT